MEILFLILAIAGIAFAFPRPREWFVRLFRKTPDVEHTLGTRAETQFHNDGAPFHPAEPHKRESRTVLYWHIRNNSDHVLQFEPGVLFRQTEARPVLSLRMPQCTNIDSLFPNHRATVFEIELTPSEIEHLRHWVTESDALGLRTGDGKEHWVPNVQYERLQATLQRHALAAGLPAEVPKGQEVAIRFVASAPPTSHVEPEGPK